MSEVSTVSKNQYSKSHVVQLSHPEQWHSVGVCFCAKVAACIILKHR